ncbi:hypothetical protein C4J81_09875 [Deltaproteobacteria bacterium Smac51]|nr:hypothetical protein C4J81_09875 [Deltaproteobacteria bacterium Smac51]
MLRKGLTLTAAVFMAGLLFISSAQAAVNFQKYDDALSEAGKQDKHVMIYFWADWCRYCSMFNEEVLPNDNVVKSLNDSFLSVQVNVDEDPDLAKKYNARTLPMIVFLDAKGEIAGYLPGYLPPTEFLEILNFVKNKSYQNN